MRKGWLAILGCALLCACGQGGDTAARGEGASGGKGTPSPIANAAASEPSPPPAFAQCSACHAVQPGRNSIGPSLAGVFGRKAGSLPGYAYSDALRNSGIVWDAASLDTWLKAPMKMVPGTRMVMGIADPQGRKAVIDYLRTLK